MPAWQLAQKWMEENSQDSMEELVGWHMSHGLVYSTNDVFLLACERHWDIAAEDFNDELPANCWFVELAAAVGHASPVREFMHVAPRPQQFAGWCRHNNFIPRVYRWDTLARKVSL
jgi:hypothetical protein